MTKRNNKTQKLIQEGSDLIDKTIHEFLADWKSAEDLEAPGLYVQRLDGKDEFVVTRLVAHIGAATKITRKLYYANNMEEVHQLEQLHADYFGPIPE